MNKFLLLSLSLLLIAVPSGAKDESSFKISTLDCVIDDTHSTDNSAELSLSGNFSSNNDNLNKSLISWPGISLIIAKDKLASSDTFSKFRDNLINLKKQHVSIAISTTGPYSIRGGGVFIEFSKSKISIIKKAAEQGAAANP